MNNSNRHPVIAEDLRLLMAGSVPWERFSGKTVLITGATGLVASYLVDALLYRNEVLESEPCLVVAMVRDRKRAEQRFFNHLGRTDLELLVQDVTLPLPPGRTANFIIHAAGNATPKKFMLDPIGTYKAAVLGSHTLLEHAHLMGCEGYLFLSSGAVHGAVQGDDTVVNEQVIGIVDPLDPYACYSESKRMGETMCAGWTRQYSLKTRICRLSHTYGPGLSRDDDRAFAEFVYSVLDQRDILLKTDGSAIRPYCYLMDAADAIFRVLLLGADGEAYLVANDTANCSIRDLAQILANLDRDKKVCVRVLSHERSDSIPNKDPARRIDVTKLRNLGWAPQFDIEIGFERTFRSLL
jgi:nucleoside-diphosphate-sugar epimerase